MSIKETDDLWRLYRREWVIVHTITMTSGDGSPVIEAAQTWIKDNLEGRIRPDDARINLNSDNGTQFWAHIKVFKDNLKGEFKHAEAAQVFASIKGYDEYTVVPRNSKSDYEIRNYGVVKL